MRKRTFVVCLVLLAVGSGVSFLGTRSGEKGKVLPVAADASRVSVVMPATASPTVQTHEVKSKPARRRSATVHPGGTRNLELAQVMPGVQSESVKRAKPEPRPFDDPEGAEAYYLERRVPAGQKRLPRERYAAARQRIDAMPEYSTQLDQYVNVKASAAGRDNDTLAQGTTLGAWSFLGPGNIGGRTRAILIHPTSPNIMYAAGVAGGVWKSTDAGASWFPLNDLMANLSVSALAFALTDPNIIYAGTGEGFYNTDAQRGNGIFKTIDGGSNWTHLTTTDIPEIYRVNDLVVSKTDANRVYAATRFGVFRTTDGGANWTHILNPDNDLGGVDGSLRNGGCSDIALRMDGGVSTDYMFVACGGMNFRDPAARIYRLTDAGAATPAFTTVFTEANMGRTSLAIAPSSPTTVYAVSASTETGDRRNGLLAVYRSTESGNDGTWTAQVRNTNASPLNTLLFSNPREGLRTECGTGTSSYLNQGWYDNVIAVDPLDANKVWVGGIDLFRSDDGGANWGMASFWQNSSSAHADQHAIVFHPGYDGTSNKTMYAGNDGGIYRTNDARAAVATTVASGQGACSSSSSAFVWTNLNTNYSVTQFYHGLPYPDGMTYVGGTQDNGTIRGSDASGQTWTRILSGDGSYVAIDPNNTNIIYAATQNFGFEKATNGVNFQEKTAGTESETGFLFITPFAMDPGNSARLWTGGTKIWRTVNGADLWVQASAELPLVTGSATTRHRVSALAIAAGDGNKVLVGTNNGLVLRNDAALDATGATTWEGTSPRANGTGYVSWVAFDPSSASTVYATISSFDTTPGDGHVFRSVNGGQSWAKIDGSGNTAIPDIPVHNIVVAPGKSQRLYIGTDLGVFVSLDGGANWGRENTGFANVVTESLAIATRQGIPNLYAFTHGRGAWRVPLATAPAPAAAFSPSPVAFGDRLMGYGNFSRQVTVSNSGTAALSIASVELSGSPAFSHTHDCPGSLAPAANCIVTVVYSPSSLTLQSGTLTITSNAPGSPHVVALSGTGIADLVFALTRPRRPTRTGTGQASSNTFELTITPATGFTGTVALSCSGANPGVSCSVYPATVTVADAPVSAKVTVKFASRSRRLRRLPTPETRIIKVIAIIGGVTRSVDLPVVIER